MRVDPLTSHKRSSLMRAVRQKGSSPEMVVRTVVHALGARFRLHKKGLPGTPDLVLPGRRLAIFVHGCFWHRHEGCKYSSTPKSNVSFWVTKFQANVERDQRKELELVALGWRVLTIWECETKDIDALRVKLKSELDL